jgi:hypothetical protein
VPDKIKECVATNEADVKQPLAIRCPDVTSSDSATFQSNVLSEVIFIRHVMGGSSAWTKGYVSE